MTLTQSTSYEQTIKLFTRSHGAVNEVNRWLRRGELRDAGVWTFVMGAETRVLYAQTPADVMHVAEKTSHALGDIVRTQAESVRPVVNFTTPFAACHLWHACLQETNRLPTWDDFLGFLAQPPWRGRFWDPLQARVEEASSERERQLACESAQWRLGNFYYGFLRDAYVIATLRAWGVDAEYHILADALFKVDFWVGDRCFAVYIVNDEYRGPAGGRKRPMERIVGDAFSCSEWDINKLAERGKVLFPTEEALQAAAEKSGLL